MKKLNFLVLFAVSVLFFSCKKDKTIICRISKVVQDNNATKTTTFTYDDQGRPSVITENGQKTKFTYTGSTGKIEYFDIATDTLIKYSTVNLTFDGSGRLASFEELYKPAAITYRYFYVFEYNAEGYLFRNIQTFTGGGSDVYYCDSLIYNNGNVSKMYSKFNDGTVYTTTDYTYSADVNGQWNFFFAFGSSGEPFSILSGYYILAPLLGKPTKNLPTNVTVSGSLDDVYDLTYTLNASNQVTEYTHVRNYNSSITTKNFKLSYLCN